MTRLCAVVTSIGEASLALGNLLQLYSEKTVLGLRLEDVPREPSTPLIKEYTVNHKF